MASSGNRGDTIWWTNYKTDAVLLADYSFDADLSVTVKGGAAGGPPCGARDYAGCAYARHTPIFPGCEQVRPGRAAGGGGIGKMCGEGWGRPMRG